MQLGGAIMSKHKVDIVGVDTAKLEVLSNAEMTELFKSFQNGNLLCSYGLK